MTISLSSILIGLALGLFGIGLAGLLITRNLIKLAVALQILVKGAVVALVWAGRTQGDTSLGQAMGLSVIVADTIVAVVFLALAIAVHQRTGTLDIQVLSRLKR